MRRLRDVLAIFLLGAIAGTGAVAFAAASTQSPDAAQAETFVASTTENLQPVAARELAVEEVVEEPVFDAVEGLSEATLRALMRHGALETSTGTDLAAQLHPAIVEVLIHRRGALAVFEDSK